MICLLASFGPATLPVAAERAGAVAESPATPGLVQIQTTTGSYGWVSSGYLTAHPNFASQQGLGTNLSAGAAPDGSAQPMSHFGCHSRVCIDVSGTNLHVNYWNTHALGNVGCSKPYFIEDNAVIIYGPQICPNLPGPGTYYYDGPTDQYYFDNTSLCNIWSGFNGEEACAVVYKKS